MSSGHKQISGTLGASGAGDAANTVRMNEADLNRLHNDLDAGSGDAAARRKHVRWNFRNTHLRVEMFQPGGVSTSLCYACRNLSGTGLGILHNAYVHIGTQCTVTLPSVGGGTTPLAGKVVRCRHVRGLVHEVGIHFLQPINIRDFIPVDPMRGAFTLESVDPERLQGSVLHVDNSAMDRRLVRHHLKESTLTIVGVEDGKSALARVAEGFDMILCDSDLPDMPGPQLVEQMRAAGVQTPVIMLSADQSADFRTAALNAKVNAFVAKPVVREQLLRALAEFLVLESVGNESGGPLYTSLKPDDPTASFVPEFVDELRHAATQMNKAAQEQNLEALRRVCLQIKGTAGGLGFEAVSESAAQAVNSLDSTKSITESIKAVRALTAMCQRARSREPEKEKRVS